jgi:glycosyltransferase involved in cell wall biosynthesis
MTGGSIFADQGIVATALIVTYNHARFIQEALDSVLAQKTTFPFEILVSEDASTDATREIVGAYARAHPDRIRTIYSEHNLRSNEVVARGIKAARGRYLAMLDGDDSWLAPDKLQRQIEFLERNRDCAAHFFNAEVVGGGKNAGRPWTRPDHPARLDLAGIWGGNPYATAGGMMRVSALAEVGAWYHGFFPAPTGRFTSFARCPAPCISIRRSRRAIACMTGACSVRFPSTGSCRARATSIETWMPA